MDLVGKVDSPEKLGAWRRDFKDKYCIDYGKHNKDQAVIMQAGCIHFPQHDETVVKAFLNLQEYLQPDYTVLTGDIYDNPVHSRHNASIKSIMTSVRKAKPLARAFLQTCIKNSKKVILIRGNHEEWIDLKKEQDLALYYDDDFTVPKELGFDDLDLQYEPDLWEYKDVVFKHGNSHATGDNAPKTEFMTELKSGGSSHTHRSGRYRHTTRTKDFVWYTTGCMCKKNMWYSLPGKSRNSSGWNHSFNVWKFIGKQFQCTQVEVIDGSLIYEGRRF